MVIQSVRQRESGGRRIMVIQSVRQRESGGRRIMVIQSVREGDGLWLFKVFAKGNREGDGLWLFKVLAKGNQEGDRIKNDLFSCDTACRSEVVVFLKRFYKIKCSECTVEPLMSQFGLVVRF